MIIILYELFSKFNSRIKPPIIAQIFLASSETESNSIGFIETGFSTNIGKPVFKHLTKIFESRGDT